MKEPTVDIAIIGCGAAGLFASIWTGRTARGPDGSPALHVAAFDGARKLGAKILVAGGGRCNVTHHHVDETAYAGSSRNAIRKVLGRFDVARTTEFFRELGVELKREETGKLFPVTDDAHTVLNALLDETRRVGTQLVFPWRVESVEALADAGEGEPRFVVHRKRLANDPPAGDHNPLRDAAMVRARRVILAAGGMALPRTGSDGHGYEIARALGHSTTPRIFPALVPLTLAKGHFLCELSGITLPTTLEVRSGSGKKLAAFTNSTLLTHFGLSGPSVLDISRYYTEALYAGGGTPRLLLSVLPQFTLEALDTHLAQLGRAPKAPTPLRFLTETLPERLARALCEHAGVDPSAALASLAKEKRRRLAGVLTELEIPVTGDRGYTYAEVTAGGIPLSEIQLSTMESRVCPGLYLCGEICDVDGRIGGFNFQWAWASGHVAGVAAGTFDA